MVAKVLLQNSQVFMVVMVGLIHPYPPKVPRKFNYRMNGPWPVYKSQAGKYPLSRPSTHTYQVPLTQSKYPYLPYPVQVPYPSQVPLIQSKYPYLPNYPIQVPIPSTLIQSKYPDHPSTSGTGISGRLFTFSCIFSGFFNK